MQSCHAAINAAKKFLITEQVHPHLVLCGLKDESALKKELLKLTAYGIKTQVFVEPDLDNSLTAIATEPLRGIHRKPMKRYTLLTAEHSARSPPKLSSSVSINSSNLNQKN